MSVTREQVEFVAQLARLAIVPENITRYAASMSNILAMADQIQTINTDNIEPMSHPLAIAQPTRDDTVTEIDQREQLLALAPDSSSGFYLVPKVIE